jgi:hypothetical protein
MGRALSLRSLPSRLKAVFTGKAPAMAGQPVDVSGLKRILAFAKKRGGGLGGWKGALTGAALVSLPFALRRWWINRQMRARGGGAAAEAASTAEANIAAAKKLQEWRKGQLAQLARAVGPGAPAWSPPSAPEAPGPLPAAEPTPGPFSRYELTPFE